MEYKCISDGISPCCCSARGCKRLEKMSDQEIINLLKHETN